MESPKPTAAKLTITDDSNHLHEIELNPDFAAVLYKAIRKGPARVSIQGCLSPGSAHATPERKHWQVAPERFSPTDLEGWEV